ncbi:MAG TPA: isoprenylcysteine carboxylmethyltransferase family protein [candidate division Zixibacteria bacterium]|nr:isoprenylcysteine carboxylmethyltransferase family protein [candidate division Zixibacteria bacterium]
MRFIKRHVFFLRGYTQALFFLALVAHVWFYPPSDVFEGTWIDTLVDTLGAACLVAGGLLRIWAVSHAGRCTRSRRLKAPMLITSGPYALMRHPIYTGNFLIGLGMVVLSESIVWIPVFLALFVLLYGALVAAEEEFLSERFGEAFERYRRSVPKYLPRPLATSPSFSPGNRFHLKELGTVLGIAVGWFCFEWIESPSHRQWLIALYHWLTGTPS